MRQGKVPESAAECKSKANTADRNSRAQHRRSMWPWSSAEPLELLNELDAISVCVSHSLTPIHKLTDTGSFTISETHVYLAVPVHKKPLTHYNSWITASC